MAEPRPPPPGPADTRPAAAGPADAAAPAVRHGSPLLFASLAGVSRATLAGDVLAGCVLAGLLVPQGLGYAGIAGVPLERGLYAAAVGLLVYAALGSSRHLVVSPTSSAAAMLAAAVAPLAGSDPGLYGRLASAVAIGTGLLLLLGGVLRLGFASQFIAKPVLKGFTFGLALRIIVKQAPALLGVTAAKGTVFHQAGHVLSSLGSAHTPTLVLGLSALALVLVLPRLTRALPPALCALALAIAAVRILELGARGVALVGSVPTGLPTPGLPEVGFGDADALWAAGAGIALIVYAESLGAARTLAGRHGYDVSANREFLALGAANVASGLFRGICVGGGLSGSAANDAAGAKSSVSVITASAIVVLTLLFLMPLFALLPQAVLAAIVVDAVRRLVDVKELARYVRLRSGVLPHLTAAVGVVALGVLPGMLLAVLVSIVILLRGLTSTEVLEVGRLEGSHLFAAIGTDERLTEVPGLVILRPEGALFFANAERVRDRLRAVLQREQPPRQVILDLGASPVLGVGGNDLLEQVVDDASAAKVELVLARVRPRASKFLERSGLLARLGPGRVFESLNDAVDASERPVAPTSPGAPAP